MLSHPDMALKLPEAVQSSHGQFPARAGERDTGPVRFEYRISRLKRSFDIALSFAALIILSPLFLLIALLIRLESAGSVIYVSRRAGAGFKVFNFYKFRTMRQGAEKHLMTLQAENLYKSGAFFKFRDDPRVTRLGRFLRQSSLDELPQLINVLKGDMSLVGNRPLPLYEAERLSALGEKTRFQGPAGLTGLWQISKRGKEKMSERSRRRLDNFYATRSSFLLDLVILLKTIPAVIQSSRN